jgi:hypothetical protein
MFEYFYHEIFRKTIIAFGSLFNNINIKHVDDSNNVSSVIKVPLAYGPIQKFLARLEQSQDLNRPVQMSLPRMSFEFVGLSYDTSRKVSSTQTFLSGLSSDKTSPRSVFMPVPYTMQFELSVMTKLNDDMLQIIEQILPYFQPGYNITIDLLDTLGEKRDIPIILEGLTMTDDYEGNYDTRRALIYTLRFSAKTYLFGPIKDVSKDIVERVSVGYVAGDKTNTPTREITYSVTPTATKSYTNNVVTNLSKDITSIETILEVENSADISKNSVIVIGEENFRVASKSGNKLTVERGYQNTNSSNHVSGSEIKLITSADSDLIEFGDDFGFDGNF